MATGTATLDFGAAGVFSNYTTVDVTGQGTILITSSVEAYMMADVTTGHTDMEHILLPVKLVCSVPTASTGFTIYAYLGDTTATGTYTVHWVWV
jgi:hypothetical protein